MSDGTLDMLMHLSSSSSPQHDYNSGNCVLPYTGLSLKTCESASLSSKCVCEQVKSSAGALPPSAPFHHLYNLHHQPSAIHVNVNQLQLARARGVREETEGCSSVGAATVKATTSTAPLLKSSSSCNCGGNGSQPTTVRSSKSTTVFNEAQLTIFYSGMVNVYNDVPAHKAEAIMVLAARSGNFPVINDNLIADCKLVEPDPFNSKAANLNAGSPGINLINTKSSALISPNISINIPDAKQRPHLIKRSHITELPYARTVSLTRFLEKRRERVQAKAGVIRPAGKIDHEEEDTVTPPSRRANKRPFLSHSEEPPYNIVHS